MALYIECPRCHRIGARSRETCWHCGHAIPRYDRVYWLEFRIDGRKHRECLGRIGYDLATEVEQQRRRERREGRYQPKAKILTWATIAAAFLRKLELEDKSTAYRRDSRRFLGRMGEFWGPERAVADITPVMVKEFRLSLRERGLSEVSCNRHMAAGNAAWHHAVENLRNPFGQVRMYNELEKQVTLYLTADQRARLLAVAKDIDSALYHVIFVAMATGLRKRNVLDLQRSEVDFDAGIITVQQKRDRRLTIPLREDVATILRNIPDDGTGYFFANPVTGKPHCINWPRTWKKARAIAGIGNDFAFKHLRHDFGVNVYDATGDLQAAQKLLGHSLISTTARYAKATPEHLRAAAERITLPTVEMPINTPRNDDKHE